MIISKKNENPFSNITTNHKFATSFIPWLLVGFMVYVPRIGFCARIIILFCKIIPNIKRNNSVLTSRVFLQM